LAVWRLGGLLIASFCSNQTGSCDAKLSISARLIPASPQNYIQRRRWMSIDCERLKRLSLTLPEACALG